MILRGTSLGYTCQQLKARIPAKRKMDSGQTLRDAEEEQPEEDGCFQLFVLGATQLGTVNPEP